jgi:hypothetical protein
VAISLVSGANLAQDLNPAGTQSSTFDTSGSDFLGLAAAYFDTVPTITDNKVNTWNLIDHAGQFDTQAFIDSYYATAPPVVGTGEWMKPTVGRAALAMAGFVGVAQSSPLDGANHAAHGGGSGVTEQPGSITPSIDGCLVLVFIYFESGTISTVSGCTIICQATGASGVGLAYVVQTTAGAINPLITFSGSQTRSASAIAAFKPQPIADLNALIGEPITGSSLIEGGLR